MEAVKEDEDNAQHDRQHVAQNCKISQKPIHLIRQ